MFRYVGPIAKNRTIGYRALHGRALSVPVESYLRRSRINSRNSNLSIVHQRSQQIRRLAGKSIIQFVTVGSRYFQTPVAIIAVNRIIIKIVILFSYLGTASTRRRSHRYETHV